MKRIRVLVVAGMITAGWNSCAITAWGRQAQTDSQTAPANSPASSLHRIYGTIRHVDGSQITLESREQHMVQVDASPAIRSYRTIILIVGRSINVSGSYDAKGVLHAQSIQRAKSSSSGWPADR